MKTLKIRAADDLAGELVLSGIGKVTGLNGNKTITTATVLVAKQEIFISEAQYWADDVQRCLAQKKLFLVEGKAEQEVGLVMIQLIKENLNNVTLPSLPDPVKLGYIYEIPRKTFEKEDIQNAIRRGVIAEVTKAEYEAMVKANEVAEASLPKSSVKRGVEEDFATRKLAELQARQGPQVNIQGLNHASNVAEIRPESHENMDLATLSPAERFALTGQAQTFEREAPPVKQSYVFDPHKSQQEAKAPSTFAVFDPRKQSAPASRTVVAGAKNVIKRAGGAPGEGLVDDGIEMG